jgi:hypothetical protein
MINRKIDRKEEKQTIRFKGMDLKETETQNKEKLTKRLINRKTDRKEEKQTKRFKRTILKERETEKRQTDKEIDL